VTPEGFQRDGGGEWEEHDIAHDRVRWRTVQRATFASDHTSAAPTRQPDPG